MSTGTKILIGILILLALVAFVRVSYPQWVKTTKQTAATATSTAPIIKNKVTKIFTDQAGHTTISGMVIFDKGDTTEPVPYIAYTDQNGHYVTKQLIFLDGRGCNPQASDLPCVGKGLNTAYPTLTKGESITVTGTFEDTRFLVESIQTQ